MAIKIFNSQEQRIKRVTICLYGGSGVGKTHSAQTLKEPTLIIDAEGGTLSVRDGSFDIIRVRNYGDALEALDYLETDEAKSKYKNVFCDSLTEINKILLLDLAARYPDKKDALKKFGDAAEYFTAFIRRLRDLEPYNIIMTAHEKVDKDEDQKRFITTQLIGKLADQLPYFFDEVFYYKIFQDENKNPLRYLITSPFENITAKDRSGALDQFESPDLQAILDKILIPNKTKKGASK